MSGKERSYRRKLYQITIIKIVDCFVAHNVFALSRKGFAKATNCVVNLLGTPFHFHINYSNRPWRSFRWSKRLTVFYTETPVFFGKQLEDTELTVVTSIRNQLSIEILKKMLLSYVVHAEKTWCTSRPIILPDR